jgi:hypothetical protein
MKLNTSRLASNDLLLQTKLLTFKLLFGFDMGNEELTR